MENMNNSTNNTTKGDVNMIKEQIKANNEILKSMIGEEVYRNFLVLKQTVGEDIAIDLITKKHAKAFNNLDTQNVTEPEEAMDSITDEEIAEKAKEAAHKIIEETLKTKDIAYKACNKDLLRGFTLYKNNGNSEVGHESNKAHIYQMIPKHNRKEVLLEAGFKSGSRKYQSPLKRGKMELNVGLNGMKEMLVVVHTSNRLITTVVNTINGCDFDDEESLKQIYSDIDYLHRTSIELIIDACKKAYNVTKAFEFVDNFVRLASMMPISSNIEDVLDDALKYRMNELNIEDFKYELNHEQVGVIEDINSASIIRGAADNGKSICIIPDKMYALQREMAKIYEGYTNKVVKTLFSPDNCMDEYDEDKLNIALREEETGDVIEIIRTGASKIYMEYIQDLNELDIYDNDYEIKKKILSSKLKRFIEELRNFGSLLLKDKEIDDKACIIKAASICDVSYVDGSNIKTLNNTKVSSMPLNVFPEFEIARNLIKEKDLGNTVNTGLRIRGKGCSMLEEGDKLVFDQGIITRVIRGGIEENNKFNIVAELMNNKNDFFDSESMKEDETGVIPDHRLYTGTLNYHKDEEGRNWAIKEMQLEDINMPVYDESKLFVRVRRTYDINEINYNSKYSSFHQLEDGHRIINEELSREGLTVEFRSKHVEYTDDDEVSILNAIIGITKEGEEILLGSYACESAACQQLYDGAYGKVVYTKLISIESDNNLREELFFTIQVEGRSTVESSESESTISSMLGKIKSASLGISDSDNQSSASTGSVLSSIKSESLDGKSEVHNEKPKANGNMFSGIKTESLNSEQKKPASTKPKNNELEELLKLTKAELKLVATKMNLKNFSQLNKEPLANLILDARHQKSKDEVIDKPNNSNNDKKITTTSLLDLTKVLSEKLK